jgi:hypothetical protein
VTTHDEMRDLADVLGAACSPDPSATTPESVFDPDPSNVYFALNGFEYRGAAHLAAVPSVPSTAETGGLATDLDDIEIHRAGDVMWVVGGIGAAAPVRTTLVAVREADEWRIKHAHRSPASARPRPGDI